MEWSFVLKAWGQQWGRVVEARMVYIRYSVCVRLLFQGLYSRGSKSCLCFQETYAGG